jgi:2-keto-3-deoxy-L-fuconate dehydrogenase
MFNFQNKSAVVTGGGSGIGKAIALLLAERGADVSVLDLDASAAASTVAEIKKAGGAATAYPCDVASFSEVSSLMDGMPSIDILVNSAGISHIGSVENTSEEDFERVFRVNVKGVYHCLHAAIPKMKQKNRGVILNMASVVSSVGIPDRFAYSMSKGAVYAMTLSVAKDYIAFGIRCNCISPARVHTPFVDAFLAKSYPGKEAEMFEKLSKTQPIGRMATPTEIAYLAVYLCSEEASFITGSDYPIDGGFIKLNN